MRATFGRSGSWCLRRVRIRRKRDNRSVPGARFGQEQEREGGGCEPSRLEFRWIFVAGSCGGRAAECSGRAAWGSALRKSRRYTDAARDCERRGPGLLFI